MSLRTTRVLFDGDGLGEISGLIYVAAAADSYVVGEELEGDDFQNYRQLFWSRHDV